MNPAGLINILVALLVAPFFIGVINRTKAIFGGRTGRPLLQMYFDLAKLVRKGAVYSRTTSWVFRAGPVVGLSAVALSLVVLPFGSLPALVSFPGDFVLFAYLLGLARFATMLAAVDTGSSFEGMGTSREAAFSAFSEPVLFMALLALSRYTGALSLTDMLPALDLTHWVPALPALSMAAGALFIIALVENSRIPVDDPNTHLELTMIHEVMVLDHSGPDFAMISYGSALKLWVFGTLVVGALLPVGGMEAVPAVAASLGAMLFLAVVIGTVESTTARLRLLRVPQFITTAAALAVFSLVLGLVRQ
jgi:formate hydrogenlyase subunit 4